MPNGEDIDTHFHHLDPQSQEASHIPDLEDHNAWADFWRNAIGVNVIPADTRRKITFVPWSEWQKNPIPEVLHNEWKTKDAFNKGMAVILGKIWHRHDKEGII